MAIFKYLKIPFSRACEGNEVEEAWKSQNLDRMVRALKCKPRNPLDRHFLLLFIVMQTFDRREYDLKTVKLCEKTAWTHLNEFPDYKPLLEQQFGCLPNVQTYHYLATILTEKGEYQKAKKVCLQAITLGIPPGKGGNYQSRIKTIEEEQVKS